MFILSKKSVEKLDGVNSKLIAVVSRAICLSDTDFAVTEGLRTVDRQKMLFAAGKTKTMLSKHLIGRAVDLAAIVNGSITWEILFYQRIARAMKKAGNDLDIKIVWGGDWKTFHDYVHFELDGSE